MKKQIISRLALALIALVSLPACAVIGGIFKVGVGVGVIMAIVVVGLIVALVARMRA